MRALVILATLALTPPAIAQDSDYLTTFLQDSLSGAGRTVTIDGFSGALSSRATIRSLTIADADGIWLSLAGLTLDWSQSALLSGALSVTELSAEAITLTRLPEPEPSTLPAPEAADFALPELPVTLDIGRLSAARITLGEAVLGEAVEANLEASLSLAGGAGQGALVLTRSAGRTARSGWRRAMTIRPANWSSI